MTSPLERCPPSIAATVAALITLTSLLLVPRSYAQQAVGVVTAVKGDAQLTRGTARKALAFQDDVVLRDIVATQERSLARILFGGSSTVTVRELSTLEVTEEVLPSGAKRTVYDMSVGAILVRVINKLLGPGDEVQIKTPNAIAAVRGTTVFTRCVARTAQTLRCTFSLLSGRLTLTPYGRPSLTLTQNTSVSITGDQATGTQVSPITTLTTAEAQQILADSEVRTALETDDVQSGIAAVQMQQATQLASMLVDTVTPPIPPASALQSTAVPSDSQQTQAPVVAGGQGQTVDEAAGPSFPATKFPLDITDQNLDLPPDTNLAQVNGAFDDEFLVNVTNSNITGTSDAITVGDAQVKGIINSDPSTFSFSGNYLLVTGNETALGPQSADVGSTFDIGESFLNIAGTGSLNSSATAALQFDHSTVTTGNSLIFIDGTAALSGSLLQAAESNFENIGRDFLEINSSLTATNANSPLLNIDPTMVTTAGDFVGVASGDSLVTAGQLLTDGDGIYDIGAHFLNVAGELHSTASQPALELTGTTISTGDDFVFIGANAIVELDGTLLKATNSDFSNIIGGDFLQVDGSLTTEGTDSPLFDIDATQITTSGNFALVNGNLSLSGPLLTDQSGTYAIGQSFLDLSGTLASSTELPLVELSGTSITTGGHFIDVSGGNLSTQGDILELTGEGSNFSPGGSLLFLDGGTVFGDTVLALQTPLTTSGAQPLLHVVDGTLTSGSLAILGANLTLNHSFLSQSGGTIAVGSEVNPADAIAVGSNTLTSVAPSEEQAAAPVFDLSGGALNVSRHLVSLEGGTANLGGPLLAASGEPNITVSGDVLSIASAVNGPSIGSVFDIMGGSLSATNLVTLAADSSLSVTGSLLDQSGGTINVTNLLNLQAPLVTPASEPLMNVSDGTLNASGSLIVLGAGLELHDFLFSQSGGDVTVATALTVQANELTTGGDAFFDLEGGSLTVTENFFNVTGGSILTEGHLVTFTGSSTLNLTGSLLDQNNGMVEVGNVLSLLAPYTTPAGQPFIRVSGGTLNTNSLVAAGADLTLQNSLLSQTGGEVFVNADALSILDNTLTSSGLPVFDLSGGSFTVANDLVNINNGTLNLGGALLAASGAANVNIGGNALTIASAVNGPSSGSVFPVDGGTLVFTGDLVNLAAESTLDLSNAKLLTVSDGSLTAANVLNFAGLVTTSESVPLIEVTSGSLSANGSLVDMSADLSLNNSALSQTGGTVSVAGDAIRVGSRTLTSGGVPVFDFSGGQYTGTSLEAAMVSANGGSLNLGGPLAVIANGASVNLEGAFLRGTDATIDVIDTEQTPQTLLVVDGAGTSLTTLGAAPLIELDPSSVFAKRALSVTGGGAVNLSAALLADIGGTFTLEDFAVVSGLGSGLSGTGLEAFIQSAGSTFNIGTFDSKENPVGDFFRVDTGGSVNLAGPLIDSENTTFNIGEPGPVFPVDTDNLFLSVSAGSSFTTASDDPVIELTGGSVHANALVGVVGGSLNLTGSGPLLSTDADFNLNAFLGISFDSSMTSATADPLMQIYSGTLIDPEAVAVVFGNSSLSPAGALLDSTSDFEVSNVLLVSGFSSLSSTADGNASDPLIQINGELLDASEVIEVSDGSQVNLARPLIASSSELDVFDVLLVDSAALTSTATEEDPSALIHLTGGLVDAVDLVEIVDGNVMLARPLFESSSDFDVSTLLTLEDSSLTGTSTGPLIHLTGELVSADSLVDILDSPVNLAGAVLGLNGAINLLLEGALLTVTDTTAENPLSVGRFLGVVDGSTLTVSNGTEPLIDLTGVTATTARSAISLASPDAMLPPTLNLSGPLLRATANSSLTGGTPENTAAVLALLDSATLTGPPPIVIGEGEEIEQPLMVFDNSGANLNGVFLQARRSLNVAEGSVTTLNLFGPLVDAADSSFTTSGNFISVRESAELLGMGQSPLIVSSGNHFSASADFIRIDDTFGGNNPGVPGPARMELAGPLLDADRTNFDLASATDTFRLLLVDNSTLTGSSELPFIRFSGTPEHRSTATVRDLVKFDNNSTANFGGTLVDASYTDFVMEGLLNNTFVNASFLAIEDGAQVTGPLKPEEGDAPPLIKLDDVTVTAMVDPTVTGTQFLSVRRQGTTPSRLELGGPLLQASNINYTTEANFLRIVELGTLNGTGETPLIQTQNSTFTIGSPVENDPTTNAFLRVDDSTTEVIGPAEVNLAGPLLDDAGSTFDIVGRFVRISDDSRLTSTTAAPFIKFADSAVITGREFLILDDFSNDAAVGGFLDLSGQFLYADNTTFNIGSDAGTGEFLQILDGSLLRQQSSNEPLITLINSTVNARDHFLAIDDGGTVNEPGHMELSGPLLHATNTTINVGDAMAEDNDNFVFLDDFATLTSTSENPLITLDGSEITTTFDFFSVTDSAQVNIVGPLLENAGSTYTVNRFLRVGRQGQLTSESSNALMVFDGSNLTLTDEFALVDDSANVAISGPLAQFTETSLVIGTDASVFNANFLEVRSASTLESTSSDALIYLDNSSVNVLDNFALLAEPDTLVETSGSFLHAVESTLNVGTKPDGLGDVLEIRDGAQLKMNSADPVMLLEGGSLTIGPEDQPGEKHVMLLLGRNTGAEDPPDQPIIGNGQTPLPFEGATNPVGSLIEATDGAQINAPTGSAIQVVDHALLEASLPIINLIGGEEAVTTLTTRDDAVFSSASQIVGLGPLIALDKSVINVTKGALLSITEGSLVNVHGDLLKLINASRINIVNGPLIRADGASTLAVTGVLVNFGGTGGNLVQVNNNIAPTGTPGGVPVNTAGNGAVNINGPVITNPGLGSITVNGAGVPGEGGFTGSLIESINNSTVNVGTQ